MVRAVFALVAIVSLVHCGGDDATTMGDATPGADAAEVCTGETGCGMECELGNDYGVGRYCTPDGGECGGSNAPFCTVDFQDGVVPFCTRPCDETMDAEIQCGMDAICRTESGEGPAGCVPMICL